MKFTLFGTFAFALALGTTITFAAPFTGSESSEIQLRSEEVISQMLSRSFEDYDIAERSFDDSDALYEYTTRSIGDSGNAEDLLVRGYSAEEELYERSADEEDLAAYARSLGPTEFSAVARSDETGEALFAREEEFYHSRGMEEMTLMPRKLSIKKFFKKIWHGIKKAVSVILRRDLGNSKEMVQV